MSFKKIAGMDKGVEDLQFQIKPKTVVFESKITPCFVLYLQKGVQVLGEYQSGNKHNTKDTLYRFKMPQSSSVRTKSSHHATYTWSFYSVSVEDKIQRLQDSVHFDLRRTIELYEIELKEKQKQLQIALKDKSMNRRNVLENWHKIRKQMRNRKLHLKSIFPKGSIHLEFQVNIYNLFDLELKEEQRKLRRSRSQANQLKAHHRGVSPHRNKLAAATPVKDDETAKIIQEAKNIHKNDLQESKKSKNATSSPQLMLPQKEENTEQIEETTKVVVVNPSGKEVEDSGDKQDLQAQPLSKQQTVDQNLKNQLFLPNKRFSTLSDIIERSHQGSSTYDYGKFSSSNGYKDFPDKVDEIPDQKEEDPSNSIQSPLMKFKTLPNEGLKKKDFKSSDLNDLRRAQTAQKMKHITQESQYLADTPRNQSEAGTTGTLPTIEKTSGDFNAKYILIIAFVIIFGIIGSQLWSSQKSGKNKSSKKGQKMPRKAK